MAALLKSCRDSLSHRIYVKSFSTSLLARLPRQTSENATETQDGGEDADGKIESRRGKLILPTMEDIGPPLQKDSSSFGHLKLQQQRQLLYYMRLIEHEMPQLIAYRKPFIPPSPAQPLVIRSVSYGGEEHPLTRKRTIVVPVSRLPLKGDVARHKFKLLAGTRWTPEAPKDSGISVIENSGKHGFIKISCEDFPLPAQNLKWISDTLDRLIAESNTGKDTFADLPLDTRHIDSRTRKPKGHGQARPSIRDFPKEWLPVRSVESLPSSAQ